MADDVLYLEKSDSDLKKEQHYEDSKQAHLARMYEKVFGTPEGQTVWEDLMHVCMVYISTFHPSARIYMNEGKRFVGLHMLSMRELAYRIDKYEAFETTWKSSIDAKWKEDIEEKGVTKDD